MVPHNKVHTEEYKATDEKTFWPVAETVLYTEVGPCTCAPHWKHRLTGWCIRSLTKQAEISPAKGSRNGGKQLGDFDFLLCIVLCRVDCIMKTQPYIAYV